MHRMIQSKKGMTLVEIIIALAILGIVLFGILTMYQLAFLQIFSSGSRTDKVLELQEIVDDLTEQNDIQKFETVLQISSYLSGEGYYVVSSEADLSVEHTGYDVNVYIAPESTQSGVSGFEVIVAKFHDAGNDYSELSTFVIKGGGI